MVGVVYVNQEGVRVRETDRLFEVLQVDVVKYEEKDFDIVMGDFNARIGLGAEEHPNSNGKRLVRVGDLSIGNQLQYCDGRWTWGSGVRKSVIDYMLFSCSAVMVGGLGEVV